jgi:hypothetical protein
MLRVVSGDARKPDSDGYSSIPTKDFSTASRRVKLPATSFFLLIQASST